MLNNLSCRDTCHVGTLSLGYRGVSHEDRFHCIEASPEDRFHCIEVAPEYRFNCIEVSPEDRSNCIEVCPLKTGLTV